MIGPKDSKYNADAIRILKQCKSRIALQVGDDDILKGPKLMAELTKNCRETQEVALLADSTISSCCPDMLTAKKYCSDSLILMTSAAVCDTTVEDVQVSPSQIALPKATVKVLQLPLHVNDWAIREVMSKVAETISECDVTVPFVLAFDSNLRWILEYLAMDKTGDINSKGREVLDQIKITSWNSIVNHFDSLRIRLSVTASIEFSKTDSKWTERAHGCDLGLSGQIVCYLSSCESSNSSTMALNYARVRERIVPMKVKSDSEESGFIVGVMGGTGEGELEVQTSSGSSALSSFIMSRMSLINFTKDLIEQELSSDCEGSIGLIVTNPHLQGVVSMRDRLSHNLRMSKLKTIKIYMSKVKPQKLDNFYGVKVWVIIACPIETNRLLAESEDYRVPLISPWEMEVAMDCREWTIDQPYKIDDLLASDSGFKEKEMEYNKEGEDEDTQGGGAIQRQNQDWSIAMPLQNNLVHFSKRSDVACPYASATGEASTIEEGLSGIASVYEY